MQDCASIRSNVPEMTREKTNVRFLRDSDMTPSSTINQGEKIDLGLRLSSFSALLHL